MKHSWWEETSKKLNQPDLSVFKSWQIVKDIPLYHPNDYVEASVAEVRDMLDHSPWKKEWMGVLALGEPRKGHASDADHAAVHFNFAEGIKTTGWVMNKLHAILSFERLREKSIIDYENIVEFGAGIGEAARLIFDRGFKGNYHVVDLAETARISSYYLDNRTHVVNNINELDIKPKDGLFIAMWSLSETPIEYRRQIAYKIKKMDQLIAFQNQFKDIYNGNFFFEEWPQASETFHRLQKLGFHIGDGGNLYMIGKK